MIFIHSAIDLIGSIKSLRKPFRNVSRSIGCAKESGMSKRAEANKKKFLRSESSVRPPGLIKDFRSLIHLSASGNIPCSCQPYFSTIRSNVAAEP